MPQRIQRAALWRRQHSAMYHLLVPVWARIPEGARWRIVRWLNDHVERVQWCDMVDAAMDPLNHCEDPCDGRLPISGRRCRETCEWMHDHAEGGCSCYCGQFVFEQGVARRRPVTVDGGA